MARKLNELQIDVLERIEARKEVPQRSRRSEQLLIDRGFLNRFGELTDLGRAALQETRDNYARSWTPAQVRRFVREAVDRVGANGWRLLVPELRVALIRAKVATVICQQDRESVGVRSVQLLEQDMLTEAGLAEE